MKPWSGSSVGSVVLRGVGVAGGVVAWPSAGAGAAVAGLIGWGGERRGAGAALSAVVALEPPVSFAVPRSSGGAARSASCHPGVTTEPRRLLLAAKRDALSAVGRIFIQEIQRWQRQQAAALGFERAKGAAVSSCQRFGSSLNSSIHWHVIVPDALFVPGATGERVDTLKHRAPTRLDLEEIVTTVATRCVRWLEKHRYLRREGEEDPAENADTDSPWMRCLQGSLGVGELQRWAEHGRADENADPARGPLPAEAYQGPRCGAPEV